VFVQILLQRWRVVLGLPTVAAVLSVFLALALPRRYTATVSFVPEETAVPRLASGLAGLSSQFGFMLVPPGSRSSRFYADLVQTRELAETILLSRYRDPRSPAAADSVRLLDLLDLPRGNSQDSLERGATRLKRMVGVRLNSQTSVVEIRVRSAWPRLSADVANRFVSALNTFNSTIRTSQARQRRLFLEIRVAEAQQQLETAENALRQFYERNRLWQQSPELVVEEGRLRRQLEVQQQVYLTLRQEYENARIQEVNDIPVITVVDSAVAPRRPSQPRLELVVLLGTAVGVIAALFLVVGTALMERLKRLEPDRTMEVMVAARRTLVEMSLLMRGLRPKRRA
jgi:uncharacterized protein involved in exopolysaccharide biosynthesis